MHITWYLTEKCYRKIAVHKIFSWKYKLYSGIMDQKLIQLRQNITIYCNPELHPSIYLHYYILVYFHIIFSPVFWYTLMAWLPYKHTKACISVLLHIVLMNYYKIVHYFITTATCGKYNSHNSWLYRHNHLSIISISLSTKCKIKLSVFHHHHISSSYARPVACCGTMHTPSRLGKMANTTLGSLCVCVAIWS